MPDENSMNFFHTTTEAAANQDHSPEAPHDDDVPVLNLTGEDLKQAPRREPLPIGTRFDVEVFEASVAYVKAETKNQGKPFYKIQFKPLPHEVEKHNLNKNKMFFETMMLFSGAFFDAARFLTALGYHIGDPTNENVEFKPPAASALKGRELNVKVIKHKKSDRTDNDGNPFINEELGGFKAIAKDEGMISKEAVNLFESSQFTNFS